MKQRFELDLLGRKDKLEYICQRRDIANKSQVIRGLIDDAYKKEKKREQKENKK